MRTISTLDREFASPQAAGLVSSFGRSVQRRYSEWVEHRRAMATVRALHYATDLELRDMGLNRGDIPMILNGRYHRD
jgi:uncharacterized protein YjiS (DUF1127 family)